MVAIFTTCRDNISLAVSLHNWIMRYVYRTNSYHFCTQADSHQMNQISNQPSNQKAKERRKGGRREIRIPLDLRNFYIRNTSKGFHRTNLYLFLVASGSDLKQLCSTLGSQKSVPSYRTRRFPAELFCAKSFSQSLCSYDRAS